MRNDLLYKFFEYDLGISYEYAQWFFTMIVFFPTMYFLHIFVDGLSGKSDTWEKIRNFPGYGLVGVVLSMIIAIVLVGIIFGHVPL